MMGATLVHDLAVPVVLPLHQADALPPLGTGVEPPPIPVTLLVAAVAPEVAALVGPHVRPGECGGRAPPVLEKRGEGRTLVHLDPPARADDRTKLAVAGADAI